MSPRTVKSLISIVIVLGLAAWAIVANDPVLGLDLQGGVTMRYELQPPDDLSADADVGSMITSTIDTLRERIDTYGIKESVTSRQGEREILIELPGKGKDEAETIKSVIARVGRLEFRILATDDVKNRLTVEDERKLLEKLLADHAGKGPEEIDVSSLDRRFPDVLYRWVPYSDKLLAARRVLPDGSGPYSSLDQLKADDPEGRTMGSQPLTAADYVLVRKETLPSNNFTGADIASAGTSQDQRGGAAVAVRLRADRAEDFGDFSEQSIGRLMVILLDDRIAQDPASIKDRLPGDFIIESGKIGGFTEAEIRDYLTVIRSGSLQMKPRLLYENTIGPSLGEAAIAAGTNATIAGLAITILFMLGYYRWHGVHASITLCANMLVLGALLMFLGATVTLPGLAGLLLTFGMSVDANILIYERMREEKERQHSPAQVIKLAFERALAPIVDSNITSFISALILYKLGSGPVKGFAVVLMLGLVTSVWAALVVGRSIYETLLETGRLKTIGSMSRFLPADLNVGFMRLAGPLLRVSGVAVIGSLIAFFATDNTKFGLDFVGGYKAQVRLAQPATQGEVKALMDKAFPGAQVVSVAEPGSEDSDRTRQFVIKIKSVAGTAQAADDGPSLEERFEAPTREALASVLLPDFVTGLELTEDTAAGTTAVRGKLNFEGPADAAAVQKSLTTLAGATVTQDGERAVAFSGTVAGTGLDPAVVAQKLKTSVEASAGLPKPSEPLVESTSIGGRAGTELRDSAIRALLLAFAAIVVYIRVRFRDYSYGLAAVIGLLHDVCITLGVIVLARAAGIVDLEIDLTMIAVFLTVIGYSLNDKIVVFDRVRENLPKMNRPLREVVDASMNQVLARTLLTASTVLLTLLVIFFMNRGQQNLLEGFAFAMIVGVVVGTYSSIFVASPVLLMLTGRKERQQGKTT
jgi:SecD/SecF fusion protein